MRFMAIPGVGPVAVRTFWAAVGDPSRFTRSRTVATHFGLTPRRDQSGDMDSHGRFAEFPEKFPRKEPIFWMNCNGGCGPSCCQLCLGDVDHKVFLTVMGAM